MRGVRGAHVDGSCVGVVSRLGVPDQQQEDQTADVPLDQARKH